jgi:hypothetical protein
MWAWTGGGEVAAAIAAVAAIAIMSLVNVAQGPG